MASANQLVFLANLKIKLEMFQHSDKLWVRILSDSLSNKLEVFSVQHLLKIPVALVVLAQALVNHRQHGACQVNRLSAVQHKELAASDKMRQADFNKHLLVSEDSRRQVAVCGVPQHKTNLHLVSNLSKQHRVLVNNKLRHLVSQLSNPALCPKIKMAFRTLLRALSLLMETHHKIRRLQTNLFILNNSTMRHK